MKSVASLSAALLARKGNATPAISRESHEMAHENDLKEQPLASVSHNFTAARRATRSFGSRPADAGAGTTERAKSKKVTDEKRIALTLRLDKNRHLGLKLISVHLDKSGQELLIELLDDLLDRHAEVFGGCACLQGAITSCAGDGRCRDGQSSS